MLSDVYDCIASHRIYCNQYKLENLVISTASMIALKSTQDLDTQYAVLYYEPFLQEQFIYMIWSQI